MDSRLTLAVVAICALLSVTLAFPAKFRGAPLLKAPRLRGIKTQFNPALFAPPPLTLPGRQIIRQAPTRVVVIQQGAPLDAPAKSLGGSKFVVLGGEGQGINTLGGSGGRVILVPAGGPVGPAPQPMPLVLPGPSVGPAVIGGRGGVGAGPAISASAGAQTLVQTTVNAGGAPSGMGGGVAAGGAAAPAPAPGAAVGQVPVVAGDVDLVQLSNGEIAYVVSHDQPDSVQVMPMQPMDQVQVAPSSGGGQTVYYNGDSHDSS